MAHNAPAQSAISIALAILLITDPTISRAASPAVIPLYI